MADPELGSTPGSKKSRVVYPKSSLKSPFPSIKDSLIVAFLASFYIKQLSNLKDLTLSARLMEYIQQKMQGLFNT